MFGVMYYIDGGKRKAIRLCQTFEEAKREAAVISSTGYKVVVLDYRGLSDKRDQKKSLSRGSI